MAVLVSWPKSSPHILSSPLQMFFTSLRNSLCIHLHHNYILQAFVLKTVICTSYFFINDFPSFLKAKFEIGFKIGLLLRLCSLGFGLKTFMLLFAIAAFCTCAQPGVGRIQLCLKHNFITGVLNKDHD